MRHGPAEDHADSGMDSDRALTDTGRDRVRGVARLLHELGEDPLEIVTSPLVRAVQTAEIVALFTKAGGRPQGVCVRREMSPGAPGAATMVSGLESTGHKRVMIVGHEPDLSALLAELTPVLPPNARQGVPRSVEKAMVVGLQIGARDIEARLRFVLDPRALKLDPDDRDPAA